MEIKFTDVDYKLNEKQLLKKVNICFKNNTITSVIGNDNDLIIKMLNGKIKPTSGDITTGKEKFKNFDKNIGSISLSNTNAFVKEVISSNLEKYNYKLNQKEKHIKDSLKMVGLSDDYLDLKMGTLSSGEKKRVFVASILAYNPDVIVFDSDILNLDSSGKNNLIKIIRILKNRFHKTIIIISNDMNLVHKISDYIYVLNKGKIVKSGTKYEIFTDEELLNKCHIYIPDVIKFSMEVLNKKKIKMGYRDEINDLLKDIYRHTF